MEMGMVRAMVRERARAKVTLRIWARYRIEVPLMTTVSTTMPAVWNMTRVRMKGQMVGSVKTIKPRARPTAPRSPPHVETRHHFHSRLSRLHLERMVCVGGGEETPLPLEVGQVACTP